MISLQSFPMGRYFSWQSTLGLCMHVYVRHSIRVGRSILQVVLTTGFNRLKPVWSILQWSIAGQLKKNFVSYNIKFLKINYNLILLIISIFVTLLRDGLLLMIAIILKKMTYRIKISRLNTKKLTNDTILHNLMRIILFFIM